MKDNIILIGMPGAGKSMGFLDTDIVIQQREGRVLQDIIDRDGVDVFLNCEQRAICSVDVYSCVVATGGSAVYSDEAMHHLSRNGTIVFLRAPYEEISRRLRDISTRADLRQTYDERAPLYEKYADITVDCSEESMESSLNEIIKKLRPL